MEEKDVRTALGEVFSQCWESEEFKQHFKEDPKSVFEEYGVPYEDYKEYKVMDAPKKTMVYVLPYEGVKEAVQTITEGLLGNVKDVEGKEAKQIIPEGWSIQLLQNTEDVDYIVIPASPEELTPEELEMINGGCGFLGVILVAGFVIVAGAVVFMGAAAVSAAAAAVVAESVGAVHAATGVTVTVAS